MRVYKFNVAVLGIVLVIIILELAGFNMLAMVSGLGCSIVEFYVAVCSNMITTLSCGNSVAAIILAMLLKVSCFLVFGSLLYTYYTYMKVESYCVNSARVILLTMVLLRLYFFVQSVIESTLGTVQVNSMVVTGMSVLGTVMTIQGVMSVIKYYNIRVNPENPYIIVLAHVQVLGISVGLCYDIVL